jgi:hypothetical protein
MIKLASFIFLYAWSHPIHAPHKHTWKAREHMSAKTYEATWRAEALLAIHIDMNNTIHTIFVSLPFEMVPW